MGSVSQRALVRETELCDVKCGMCLTENVLRARRKAYERIASNEMNARKCYDPHHRHDKPLKPSYPEHPAPAQSLRTDS